MSESPPPSWKEMLASAASVQEVLAIARDYQDRLEPGQVFKLPSTCRPRAFGNAIDLSAFAYDLKKSSFSIKGDSADLVEEMAGFFAQAALRITQLTGPHHESVAERAISPVQRIK